MSNRHTVVSGEARDWKYNSTDDDAYYNKEGCKTVKTESKSSVAVMLAGNATRTNSPFVVCANNNSRALKNCNSYAADNESSTYNAVDEKVCYINKNNGPTINQQHEILGSVEKERNYNTNEQQQQQQLPATIANYEHKATTIDWRDGEEVDFSSTFNDVSNTGEVNESASFDYETNFAGDDEFNNNCPFEEVEDYYEGAVGGCGCGCGGGGVGVGVSCGDIYWDDDNETERDFNAEDDETGATDDNEDEMYSQNNRFATEIGESFDNDGNFRFEDIYNESDFELDDDGHFILKTDTVNVEYYNGMTIEEMGKLMERAKLSKKSTD